MPLTSTNRSALGWGILLVVSATLNGCGGGGGGGGGSNAVCASDREPSPSCTFTCSGVQATYVVDHLLGGTSCCSSYQTVGVAYNCEGVPPSVADICSVVMECKECSQSALLTDLFALVKNETLCNSLVDTTKAVPAMAPAGAPAAGKSVDFHVADTLLQVAQVV